MTRILLVLKCNRISNSHPSRSLLLFHVYTSPPLNASPPLHKSTPKPLPRRPSLFLPLPPTTLAHLNRCSVVLRVRRAHDLHRVALCVDDDSSGGVAVAQGACADDAEVAAGGGRDADGVGFGGSVHGVGVGFHCIREREVVGKECRKGS